MTVEKKTELLIDWLEGELSPEEAVAVEEMVAKDPECAREVEELRQVLAAVTHPADDPGETYFASFYPRLRERAITQTIPWYQQALNWFWSPGVWLRAGAGATAMIVAVIGTLLVTNQLPSLDWQQPTMTAKKGMAIKKTKAIELFDVATMRPELQKVVATLENDDLDDLRIEIANMLVEPDYPEQIVTLPGTLPEHPVVDVSSVGDMDAAEIMQVAELLSQDVKNWTL